MALLLATPMGGAAAAGVGGQGTLLADVGGRCNSRMLNDLQASIREYDAHPAANNTGAQTKRFGEINQILTDLNEEHGILDNVCSGDAQTAELFGQLGATAAWALALESDLAPKLNDCAAAAKALQQAMLSQAWLDLANVVNNNSNGQVLPSIAEVAPKVQSRAQAIALTLPAYADTSAYWRDNNVKAARDAALACSSPTPSPAPSATP